MDDKDARTESKPGLASVQEILQKLARLSPEEARQLTAYLSHGAIHEAQVGTRLQNAVIQSSAARTLVMLSGGLDSVAMLYLLLKHAQGLPLHAHHVKLYGWESATKPLAESIAIRNITGYLWDQGFRFEYSESAVRFDYTAFDQTIYYFQAACLAASAASITSRHRSCEGRCFRDRTYPVSRSPDEIGNGGVQRRSEQLAAAGAIRRDRVPASRAPQERSTRPVARRTRGDGVLLQTADHPGRQPLAALREVREMPRRKPWLARPG